MKWLYNHPDVPKGLPKVLYFTATPDQSSKDVFKTIPNRYTAHLAPELSSIYTRIRTGREFSRLPQSLDMACSISTDKLRCLVRKRGYLGLAMEAQDFECEFGFRLSNQKRADGIYTMRTCAAFVYDLHLSIRAIQRKQKRKLKGRINWDSEGSDLLKILSRAVKQLQGPFKPDPRLKMVELSNQKSGAQRVPLAIRAIDELLKLANDHQRTPTRKELIDHLVKLYPSLKMKSISMEQKRTMTAAMKMKEEKKLRDRNKTFWSEQLQIAGLATL